MTCNSCETTFQGSQTLVVSVAKSGTSAVLSIGNQGRNIALISRILLCMSHAGGTTVLYLRAPPNPISWMYPSAYLEPGITATYYIWNGLAAGSLVQAQAEYVEIEGRSRSCPTTIWGEPMAQRYWKLERSGELGAAEIAAAVGGGGHIVLRTDFAHGKTTIYFAGESEDEHAKAVRAHATEIKLADVTKLWNTSQARLLTQATRRPRDEARRIAANIAKLAGATEKQVTA